MEFIAKPIFYLLVGARILHGAAYMGFFEALITDISGNDPTAYLGKPGLEMLTLLAVVYGCTELVFGYLQYCLGATKIGYLMTILNNVVGHALFMLSQPTSSDLSEGHKASIAIARYVVLALVVVPCFGLVFASTKKTPVQRNGNGMSTVVLAVYTIVLCAMGAVGVADPGMLIEPVFSLEPHGMSELSSQLFYLFAKMLFVNFFSIGLILNLLKPASTAVMTAGVMEVLFVGMGYYFWDKTDNEAAKEWYAQLLIFPAAGGFLLCMITLLTLPKGAGGAAKTQKKKKKKTN